MAKKRNPADSTTRNDRALGVRIQALKHELSDLRAQVLPFVEAMRKVNREKMLYAIQHEPRLLKAKKAR